MTDSGVGVPEALREVIFDAFVQAHTTSEAWHRLTLAKHIVALHEGTSS